MPSFHLEYQLTATDFAEARRRYTFNPGSILLLCSILASLILFPQALHPQPLLLNPPSPNAPTPPIDLLFPGLSWLLILGWIWFIVFRMLRRLTKPPWKIPRQRQKAPSPVAFWVYLVLSISLTAATAIWTIHSKRQAAAILGLAVDPSYSPVFETLFPILPLLVVCILIPFGLRRFASPTRLWSRQYHLQRPFTTEIDDQSLRIFEPLSTHAYTWPYFRAFNQTPNLFLLYPSSLQFIIIPKRAFPTPESQQQFTNLLSQNITPPTGGFPLVPQSPTPVPSTHSPSNQ